MLDGVVSHLLSQPILVDLQKVPDVLQSLLFEVELPLYVISLCKFIGDVVIHLRDLFLGLLHLLVDSELKALDLLEVLVDVFLLALELSYGSSGSLEKALLVSEVLLHFINLGGCGQLTLPGHGLLHVLEKSSVMVLELFNLFLVSDLLLLELLGERVDLLLLLVKDLVLLLLIALGLVFHHILRNIFDVLLVSVNHFLGFDNFLVHLLDLSVILFDPVLEPFSGLWEWQVHLIGL